jgi:predicted ATPase
VLSTQAIEFLQRTLSFTLADDAEEKLAKLENALAAFGFDLPGMVPLFAALLSVPNNDRYPALARTPQRQKEDTFEAIVKWLMRCAERGPTRLVVEDLHWADPSTLELIGPLIDQVSSARLLLILTFRPEFRAPWPSQGQVSHITLGRLSSTATELIIRSVAGDKQLPTELTGEIVTKTDGVPLFVEELTQMVLESGWTHEEDDRYVLGTALRSLEIPSTLHDSLMARLDRLGTAKEVAQLGAIIGKEFSYEVLRAIAPFEETKLTGALNRLVDSELLAQRIVRSQVWYWFKHALIRDAAYESLLKSKRRQYHAQLAKVLQEGFPEIVDSNPELVASHYTNAGLAELAIPWWQAAGQRALQRSANQEAIRHLTKGLDLLTQLPDTPEHRRQELFLRVTLGPALMAAKGFSSIEAQHMYARAQQLSQQMTEGPLAFQVSWAL